MTSADLRFESAFPAKRAGPPGLACAVAATLLTLGVAPAGAAEPYPLGCSFVGATGELLQADGCAREEAGTVRIAPPVRARMRWQDGLGEAAVGRSWFYVRRDGRATRMVTLDAGPDPFAEGLARSLGPDGIVFVDHELRPVIATGHGWATPFADGLADVCRGCREQREGEHSLMVGGRWGVIDRRGRVVAPTDHESAAAARARLPADRSGTAR